jgi:hypothetical protein
MSRAGGAGELTPWPLGVREEASGDATLFDARSLADAVNVEFNATGGVTRRAGITLRMPGVTGVAWRLFYYEKGDKRALIESDGATIRVLTRTGWVQVGAFASAGDRVSGVMNYGRLYLVNGAAAACWRVVEWLGGVWDVRAPGVATPTAALSLTITTEGSSSDTCTVAFAIAAVDDRGFRSNAGASVSITCKVDATVTIGNIPALAGHIVKYAVFGTHRDANPLFWIKDTTATSTTVDTDNSKRITLDEAPVDNDPPPDGVDEIYLHNHRVRAAIAAGPYYAFTEYEEPEYWPADNAGQCMSQLDASPIYHFLPVRAGLMHVKRDSRFLLDQDPKYGVAPDLNGTLGVLRRDACAASDGVALLVSRYGLIAVDGGAGQVEARWKMATSSAELRDALRVCGFAGGGAISLAYGAPDNYNAVREVVYEARRQMFRKNEYEFDVAVTTGLAQASFADETSVDAFENVAESTPTIAAGGGTTTVRLSGPVAATAGCSLKFVGATALAITSIVGAESTPIVELAAAAPANGTAVSWCRGTEVAAGVLRLTAAGAVYASGAYWTDIVLLATLDDFLAFADKPLSTKEGAAAAGAELRYAIDFGAGPREYTGADWVAVYGAPAAANAYGMSAAELNALTAADMLKEGGMSDEATQLVARVYAIGDGAATPTLELLTAWYVSGARPLVAACTVPDAVPISGPEVAATPAEVPSGTYLVNEAGGYRLGDGETDAGAEIEARIVLQPRMVVAGDAEPGAVVLDVRCTRPHATLEVSHVIAGREYAPEPLVVALGRDIYKMPPPARVAGCTVGAVVRWRDRGVTIEKGAIAAQPRPEAR